MTLTKFLLERITEDETTARAASPGPWHLNAEHDEVLAVDDITVCEAFALSGPQTRATAEHIVHHDPSRALADCETKRRIVELHDRAHECSTYDHTGEVDNCSWCLDAEDCSTLRLLALPYADHPDYDEEWRP